ncbi:MAG: hypothetical protein IJ648_06065 [Lachnospiraceae bacterium]|nr:hypothetical protein [Lachnospiraceae bacterium]
MFRKGVIAMIIKYRKFQPAEYVLLLENGKVIKQGKGIAFFYNTYKNGIVVIPAIAIDECFAFDDIVTNDFQTVCVQGVVTFAAHDYEQVARMVDFSYCENAAKQAEIQAEGKRTIGKRLNNIAKAMIANEIARHTIRETIMLEEVLVGQLMRNLKEDPTVHELGIEVLSVNILGIAAKPETKKALEAAAREEILKQQDDAIYMRRNAAIEQERLIRENELNTEICVAEKEKERREKELLADRLIQEQKLETETIVMRKEMELQRDRLEQEKALEEKRLEEDIKLEEGRQALVEMDVQNEKKQADAEAYAARALLDAFTDMDVKMVEALMLSNMDYKKLIAKAVACAGDKLERIGNLNITPDLLTVMLGKEE